MFIFDEHKFCPNAIENKKAVMTEFYSTVNM